MLSGTKQQRIVKGDSQTQFLVYFLSSGTGANKSTVGGIIVQTCRPLNRRWSAQSWQT